MTVAADPAPTTTRRPERDLGRFAGVAFAFTFFGATTLWGLETTIYGTDLDGFAASAGGSTRATTLILSHLVMPLAAVLFLWSVARLRNALDAAAGHRTVAGQVAFGSAVVTAAGFCLMAAAQHVSVLAAGGGYLDGFPADPAVGYGMALLSGNLGNATVWGAAVVLVALGAQSRRHGLLPRWLVVLGYVAAPLLIAGWYYQLPVLLLCLWVALAGLRVQTEET